MGFKKLLGDITDKIKEENEKRKERKRISEEVDAKARAEFNKQWAIFEKLLDKFEMKDFKDFCDNILGVGPPAEYGKDSDGREVEYSLNRDSYVNFIKKYFIDGPIQLSQVQDFALKRKIIAPSFFGVESQEVGTKRDFENIINSIKTHFQPERIHDEKELQAQLVIFLKAKFPEMKIDREITTKSGDKLDILIDDKYVLELKVPKKKTHLRNLSAQLEEYSEEYPNLCAVIADISDEGRISNDDIDVEARIAELIKEYADKYMMKYKVPSVILNVGMRR